MEYQVKGLKMRKHNKVRKDLETEYLFYKEYTSEKMDDKDFFVDEIDEAKGTVKFKMVEQVRLEMQDYLKGIEEEHDAEAWYAEDKYICKALIKESYGIYGD